MPSLLPRFFHKKVLLDKFQVNLYEALFVRFGTMVFKEGFEC